MFVDETVLKKQPNRTTLSKHFWNLDTSNEKSKEKQEKLILGRTMFTSHGQMMA